MDGAIIRYSIYLSIYISIYIKYIFIVCDISNVISDVGTTAHGKSSIAGREHLALLVKKDHP
jgi:hypothetical protein